MSDRFSRHLRLDLLYGGLGRTVHGERAHVVLRSLGDGCSERHPTVRIVVNRDFIG